MAQATIQGSFLGDATVTGAKIGADFISAQTELDSPDLISTDEILVSDGGVIKRMDIAVLEIAGTQITSAEIPPARLGSGSSIGTKFLRGDSTWQTVIGAVTALSGNVDNRIATFGNTVTELNGESTLTFASGVLTVTGNIVPGATNSHDLGTSSLQWQNIYTQDFHLNNTLKDEGNSIDGTKGNWTIQEGAEDLFIVNNETGKKYKFDLTEVS